MRAFRLKRRNVKTGQVTNQRDYIGIENFLKYGVETWARYNHWDRVSLVYNPDGTLNKIVDNDPAELISVAELYEKIDGKWVRLEYKSQIPNPLECKELPPEFSKLIDDNFWDLI